MRKHTAKDEEDLIRQIENDPTLNEDELSEEDKKYLGQARLIRRRPRDPDKVEVFCRLAEAAVAEGVIFDGNKIVEILPW